MNRRFFALYSKAVKRFSLFLLLKNKIFLYFCKKIERFFTQKPLQYLVYYFFLFFTCLYIFSSNSSAVWEADISSKRASTP